MQRFKILLILGIVLWVGYCPASDADIYCYVGKDGVRHFTNTPTTPEYRVFIRSNPRRERDYSSLPDYYDHFISQASSENGLEFSLIKAVIKVESNFDKQAVSRAGAMGLMQIMPENLTELNVNDPFDPWQNITGGVRYLKSMIDRFDGDLQLALAAYNAGPTRVEQHSGIPPYPETVNYVQKVLKYAKMIHEN